MGYGNFLLAIIGTHVALKMMGEGEAGSLFSLTTIFTKKGLTLVQIFVSDLTMDAQLDKECYVYSCCKCTLFIHMYIHSMESC